MGRVLVVMTEFVVILAFASRFYFDKKLNDLNEEIEGKLAVIQGYAEIESGIREVLARQSVISGSRADVVNIEEKISGMGDLIPLGVTLTSLRVENKSVEVVGSAGSEALFAQTLANFKRAAEVSRVSLGQTSYDQTEGVVVFNIRITYK